MARLTTSAMEFCDKIGFKITYPVHLSELGSKTLALANRKYEYILLSERVLTMGVKQVVSALIEEQVHLQHELNDNTTEMQTWLFDQIVTMGELLVEDIL
jgi:hypothetical protein